MKTALLTVFLAATLCASACGTDAGAESGMPDLVGGDLQTRAASLRITLSDEVVAPGGNVVVTVEVVDQTGAARSAPQASLSIQNKGANTGAAPVINGSSITFPKVQKALLDWNQAIDPDGELADADPKDPNFGIETGGLFKVVAILDDPPLTGEADVVVLPTGTAENTVKVYQYTNGLTSPLEHAAKALAAADSAGIKAAQDELRAFKGNTDYSVDVMRMNDVMTPPNGWLPTLPQLMGAGFKPESDDAQFAASLAQLIKQLQAMRVRLDAVAVANLSQADVDELQSLLQSYQSLSMQLANLNPSTLGIVGQGDNLDQLMRYEVPALLDSISKLTDNLLTEAATRATMSSASRAMSPGRMSDRVDGLDGWWTFVTTMINIVTDMKGSAKGNIIEGGISLANSIGNIVLAHVINLFSGGTISVDRIQASSSIAYVCAHYKPTVIEGDGFCPEPSQNLVLLLGCTDSQLWRNLLTLKKPSQDAGARSRFVFKIVSIAKGLAKDTTNSDFSLEVPDTVEPGILSPQAMNFDNGWSETNLSRLPCAGLVWIFNLESADFLAENMTFIPGCP